MELPEDNSHVRFAFATDIKYNPLTRTSQDGKSNESNPYPEDHLNNTTDTDYKNNNLENQFEYTDTDKVEEPINTENFASTMMHYSEASIEPENEYQKMFTKV